jgi:hypothetical protein
MLTAALLVSIWRHAVVQPPTFRPAEVSQVAESNAHWRAKELGR